MHLTPVCFNSSKEWSFLDLIRKGRVFFTATDDKNLDCIHFYGHSSEKKFFFHHKNKLKMPKSVIHFEMDKANYPIS